MFKKRFISKSFKGEKLGTPPVLDDASKQGRYLPESWKSKKNLCIFNPMPNSQI